MGLVTDQLEQVISTRDQQRYSVVVEAERGKERSVRRRLRETGVEFDSTDLQRRTIFTTTVGEEVIRELADVEGVIRVDYNGTFTTLGTVSRESPVSPELDVAEDVNRVSLRQTLERVSVPEAWETLDSRGDGVRIGLLDTPIAERHPSIRDSVVETEANGTKETHGTWVASAICGSRYEVGEGVVQGAAPDADLYAHGAVQGGAAGVGAIAEGIRWLIDRDVQIINLSVGGSHSAVLESVVREAERAGVLVVSSVGNSGPGAGSATCPAHHPSSVAVGSVGPDGTPAVFSSRGPGWNGGTTPALVAHGGHAEQRESGVTITESVLGAAAPTGAQFLVGTSMAAPQVAGIAALRIAALRDIQGRV